MTFEDLYSGLNQAQKKSVDAVDGTVMVIAGPGTGKTQVLGARVANILQKTDTAAENILCLTFTEAATVALRNRLFDFIGSSAHRVNIYTYHGFCNTVIQENKELFGIADLEPLADLERIEVIREIIDELDSKSPLKRFKGEVYFDLQNLTNLFNLFKKENYTVTEILGEVDSYLEHISESEDYKLKRDSKYGKKGEFKADYYKELEKMETLKAACVLFDVYEEKLKKRRRYDYNDMILWVLQMFKDHPELLRSLQETYHYFLVDEYQDTNGAQNDLLSALIDYWVNPNVFVVGDDDQSIYKFQGANVENIQHFHDEHKDHIQLVCLTENYRSSQEILDTANQVISHNDERLVSQIEGLSKIITASNPDVQNIKGQVESVSYPNTYQEIVSVAGQLKALKESGTDLRDVAVLYRNHSQSTDLIDYLLAEEIPFTVTNNKNVLEVPLVQQVIKMLTYIAMESKSLDSGQHLLYEILHFNTFQFIKPIDISRLSNAFGKNYEKGWREQLNDWKNEDPTISEESYKEIKRFASDVEYWIAEIFNKTLQGLTEEILSKCGFVSRALSGSDPVFEMQCLNSFYSFLKEETARDPKLDLEGFLEILDLMESHKIPLLLRKVVHGENGVQLMTVHGSKGLEFDHVFLIGCTEDKWEKTSGAPPFNLNRIIPGEPAKAAEEESRRLFYVALTRARKSLHISYAKLNEKDKSLSKSAFVVEAEESSSVIKRLVEIKDSEALLFFERTLSRNLPAYQDLISNDFVKAELEKFRMNATNLNSYLKCPVAFFYQNIIRVPSAKNEAMTFGSAVHFAIEMVYRFRLENKQLPPSGLITDKFEQFMLWHRESFTDSAFERRLEYGRILLPDYYRQRLPEWEQEAQFQTEMNFKNLEFDGIPIRGQVDKIVINGNNIQVVDYKTGKYQNARQKLNPPLDPDKLKADETDHNKIHGGDYWRQLYFYKVLLDADSRYTGKVTAGILDFVEPENDTFHTQKLVFEPQHESIVKGQIRDVYKRIMNAEFDEGCGQADCIWCMFREYYLKKKPFSPDSLIQLTLDEIDER